jgi:hypothetical protein
VIKFNEAVTGVSASTVKLRDVATNTIVAATVAYDRTTREARIVPVEKLGPARTYRVGVGSAVMDAGGNPVTATSSTFTTGMASFRDTAGTAFESEIEWLVAAGITRGCGAEKFCPGKVVTRQQIAGFLARALSLPPSDRDYFSDDEASPLEDEINRVAYAGLTSGCRARAFCPTGVVTRAQMATFLARAFNLPATGTDFFVDDDGSAHEDSINRLAAAGIISGCASDRYCPTASANRGQLAALLYRALGD